MNSKAEDDQTGLNSLLNPFTKENWDDYCVCVLPFAIKNNLVLATSLFKHKRNHKITRVCNSGSCSNKIDNLLDSKHFRSSIQNVRIKCDVCIGLYHNMAVFPEGAELPKSCQQLFLDYETLCEYKMFNQYSVSNHFVTRFEAGGIEEEWKNIAQVLLNLLLRCALKRQTVVK